jgi:hypothetical protein
MVEVLSVMYKYATLKPVEVILRRGVGEEGEFEGEEPNWGIICVCMKMSQGNAVYNYVFKMIGILGGFYMHMFSQ